MHTRRSRISLVVVASLSVVGAVAVGHARSPSPPTASGTVTPRSNVSELITFIPPTATSAAFTDWGRIKASQGADDITSASPTDEKMAVAMSTNSEEAATSGYGIAHLRDMYDTWGWDSFDLDWEATIQGDWPAPVRAPFPGRRRPRDPSPPTSTSAGSRARAVPGATIRSHEMVLGERLAHGRASSRSSTPHSSTTAGRSSLSVDLDQVKDVVANHGSYAPSSRAGRDRRQPLDGASAALFLPGLGTCLGFAPLPIDIGDPLASPDLSFPTAGLHPYAVLGIGYGRPDWSPIGRIIFGYLDDSDRTGRPGGPPRAGHDRHQPACRCSPYADALFRLSRRHVDGANLTLDVAPGRGDRRAPVRHGVRPGHGVRGLLNRVTGRATSHPAPPGRPLSCRA